MVKQIVRDQFFLQQKSEPATEADKQVVEDLLDTLRANQDRCVGMAANMIGVAKRIIIFDDNGTATVMFTPEIVRQSDVYEAEEGCLSLEGTRKTARFREIEVKYQDPSFKWQKQKFSGQIAQIIQHECDHLEGKII